VSNVAWVRALYPGAEECVYLDTAAVGLVSTRVRDAVTDVLEEHVTRGIAAAPAWTDHADHTRGLIAELIGGRAANVAFTQNTSTGIALVANGIDWAEGDNVVVPADEFPSNFYPWLAQRRHDVEVREVPMVDGHADLAALGQLVDGHTRVVAISAVQYTSGHRYDLAEVRALSRHALLLVDGTQAAGALVIDADAAGVDALAVSAHKWLNGPFGIGFVHLSDRAMEVLQPSTTGWLSVEHPFDFDHEPRMASDGRRFESGTHNAAGIAGLAASVSTVLEIGRDEVERVVLSRAAELQALITAEGLQAPRSANSSQHSGIVFATSGEPDTDAATYQRLIANGIRCSLRSAGVRFSPHYFNSPQDLSAAAAQLPKTR
jgi:selenocysteine lyase/cysteine desulfurase